MLAMTLWFGMLWPQIAPLLIVPGMTQEQVEAILGKPATFIASGSVNSEYWTSWYAGRGVTVYYTKGVVESVSRRKP